MRNLFRVLFLCSVMITAAHTQPSGVYNPPLIFVTSDPSGSCGSGYNTQNVTTGNQMTCANGTWVSINGGGGGGATIPATTNIIKGDGAGNGANSKVAVTSPATAATIQFLSDNETVILPNGTLVANPMTNPGDMIYGGSAGAPAQLVGNTTTQPLCLIQIGDGTSVVSTAWQACPNSGNTTYYLSPTSSDISTYLQATETPYSPLTQINYAGLSNGANTIQNWATRSGVPGVSFLSAGTYECHLHASKTAGSTISMACQIWEVSSTGVDIGLITTSPSTGGLTTSNVEYRLESTLANVYIMSSSSSRVVTRVVATVSGGPGIAHIFVGDTSDSHLSLPSNTVDVTNFVPYTGAISDLNLGVHNLSVAAVNKVNLTPPTTAWTVQPAADNQTTTIPAGTLLANSRTVSTTAPLGGGGDLSSDRTVTCTTCVVASSPGAGVAHFAGSTQTTTSSAVVEGDQSLSDITTANVSTSSHGYAPKSPNDATKFLDGTGVYAGTLHSVSLTIDGGGSAIATGAVGVFPAVDYACTINRVDITADQSGSITVDVWKANAAIPTSGGKISASAPLTLSSAQISLAGSLTGWSTSVAIGDVFGFSVASATTVQRITGVIWCK